MQHALLLIAFHALYMLVEALSKPPGRNVYRQINDERRKLYLCFSEIISLCLYLFLALQEEIIQQTLRWYG